jgi:hypothetical protein
MGGKRISVGDDFGTLEVIEQVYELRSSGKRKKMHICRCDCGNEIKVEGGNLSSGNTTRCNNCAIKTRASHRFKHGHSLLMINQGTVESKCYYTWQAMKQRCYNEKESRYARYGGRGISVCWEWIDSYESFLSDMGLPPTMEHQIDRVDNDGNYNKSNCRWVSRQENANNKSNNLIVTANGKSQTLMDWERETGIGRTTIKARLDRGYSPEIAVSTKERLRSRVYKTPFGEFNSLPEASKETGLAISTISGRFKSDSFPEWACINLIKKV